ncbi:hypothetical protein HY441_02510 [Candidatus Microgenomates bacterium]|nr:hypothetical protein [Candidatus Microgenomates bacterium]
MKAFSSSKKAEWVLRVAVAGEFFGHGVFALQVKKSFVPLVTGFGFSEAFAKTLLPVIGVVDIVTAIIVLLWPVRILLAWMSVWGFLTGLARPVAGEPVWDFVERWANWGAPLALLLLRGLPRQAKDWLR